VTSALPKPTKPSAHRGVLPIAAEVTDAQARADKFGKSSPTAKLAVSNSAANPPRLGQHARDVAAGGA
jgi:hypothetical protein